MKIADVFNEKSKEYYWQENATEYAYITADEYTPTEVIEMEKKMVTLLGFNLLSPSIHFLYIYNRILNDPKATALAEFLADVCIFDLNFLKFRPSLLCSVYLFLGYQVLKIIPEGKKINSRNQTEFMLRIIWIMVLIIRIFWLCLICEISVVWNAL